MRSAAVDIEQHRGSSRQVHRLKSHSDTFNSKFDASWSYKAMVTNYGNPAFLFFLPWFVSVEARMYLAHGTYRCHVAGSLSA